MQLGFMQGRLSPPVNGRIQSFPWEYWREEFTKAQKIGFQIMEWTIDSENYMSNPIFSKVSEIRELSAQHNIKIPSVTNDHFMEMPPWSIGEENSMRNLLKLIKAMGKINSKLLVIPLVDNSSIINDIEKESLVKNFFGKIYDELENNEIQISFELDLEPISVAKFIGDFPSNLFGINYDIGNSASLGYDAHVELTLYGDRVTNVHVKDRIHGGSTVKLGNGCADFTTVFQHFERIQYSRNYILQTARALDNNHESTLIYSREFVEKFFQGKT